MASSTFFATGIAAVIGNDTHLTTRQHHPLAVEAAAKCIAQRAKGIGDYRERHGRSVLAAALAAPAAASSLKWHRRTMARTIDERTQPDVPDQELAGVKDYWRAAMIANRHV